MDKIPNIFFSIKTKYSKRIKKKQITILGIKITFIKFNIKNKINRFLEICISLFNSLRFILTKIKPETVLIIEPNSAHGEILPGYIKYFKDLGYNVDLFYRWKNHSAKPFIKKNFNSYVFAPQFLKLLLKNKKIKKYEFLFLSSSAFWENDFHMDSFLNYINYVPETKNGILLIEHNLHTCLAEYNEEKFLRENRLFALSYYDGVPMLNPHYFGNFVKNISKNKKTKFIIAGHWMKNKDLFFDTIENLIDNNIYNFEVSIIGTKTHIPRKIKKYVKSLGFINFPKMYDLINKSDFILPMLDSNEESHKRYYTESTSGSRQLSYGFLKPMLIEQKFADVYDLTEKNSLVYQDKNQFFNTMKKAISMSQDEYSQIVGELDKSANFVYEESLSNLKNSIEKAKQQ